MTYQTIVDTYLQEESVKMTAKVLNISEGVVRKVLVSYGIIDTELTRKIAALREEGLSSDDIAKQLEISKSWVSAHTPYSKGTYLVPSETENAVRLRAWREKKKS